MHLFIYYDYQPRFLGKYILGPKYFINGTADGTVPKVSTDGHNLEFSDVKPPMLGRSFSVALNDQSTNPNLWIPHLLNSIREPRFNITFFHAICIRMYRVYWGLFLGIYLGWIFKEQSLNELTESNYKAATLAIGLVMLVLSVLIYAIFPRAVHWAPCKRLFWNSHSYSHSNADI